MDIEIIQEKLDSFVRNHTWEGFEWRKHQKEAVISIINTFISGEKSHFILDASTGSGKSIIALAVSYVLNKLGYRGYILTSDLSLQDQYERDIKRMKLGFGIVRGIDNYKCDVNNEKHSLGDCKIRNLNSHETKSLKCYKECPYYFARDYASFTPTSVLNYSLYLIHLNYVAQQLDNPPFTPRDFVICDEAHKIVEIVQNHFSPTIDQNTYSFLERLRSFLADKMLSVPYSGYEIKDAINKIFAEEDKEKLYIHLKTFEKILASFVEHTDELKKFIKRKYHGKRVPKNWFGGLRMCDHVKDMHCKFEDYNYIISKTDVRAIIKNGTNEQIQFNCINEKYLMEKYFHCHTKFSVFMSATIGDPQTFLNSIKGKSARALRIPSTFNFDKSPIYVYMSKSMSFKTKEHNFPWIISKIEEILKKHPNERGIIQTGSYENSKKIYENISDNSRLLIYTDSSDKKEMLFKFTGNKVIMGPSLLEGLDLKDDMSRFQIIAKVPFPSLTDKFVNAKMKVDPEWYSFKTIIGILQGVGRSVRSENDYAVTYILDADFMRLIRQHKKHFPEEFLARCVFLI